MTDEDRRLGGVLSVVLPVASALLLRQALGYRPFPSIDEFAYAPVFRSAADPIAYARDVIVAAMPPHAFLWSALFRLGERAGELPLTMYVATFVLSVATTMGAFRLMRALGVRGLLFPLVAILAFGGAMKGIGRGTYDGAFGAGVHGQWMALAFLLLAYDALARGRDALAGALLGASVLGHVGAAVHGAFALVVGLLMRSGDTRPRLRALLVAGGACALVSAPVTIPVLHSLLSPPSNVVAAAAHVSLLDSPALNAIDDLWIRRLPHEYSWNVSPLNQLGFLLYCVAGIAGYGVLARFARPATDALRTTGGVAIGHAVLAGAAGMFYGPLAHTSVLAYSLSLTRTTPLLVVIAAVLAVAALEKLAEHARSVPRMTPVLVTTVALLLLLFVRWSPSLIALLVLGALLFVAMSGAGTASLRAVAAAAFIVAGATALAYSIRDDRLALDVPAADAELYAFARTAPPRDALFITPPGLDAFRFFARRGSYVDWRLFPTPVPSLLPLWLHRLEEIAAPDAQALESRGWPAVPRWDETYARRNTPQRISGLLADTGADYFVLDRSWLQPASGEQEGPPSASLTVAFENAKFVVYRRGAPAEAALNPHRPVSSISVRR